MKKTVVCVLMLVFGLNISACGYFLYPERVGQASGKIDPTVVLLDAAGLLVGILPGVVAFAVDLTTGAIYLAPGEESSVEKHRKTLGVTQNVDLTPVNKSEITIDTQKTAKDLSRMLGRSVDANDIEYFKPEDGGAAVAWKTQS